MFHENVAIPDRASKHEIAPVAGVEPQAMSVKEFCAAYSVGKSYAYILMKRGDLSYRKMGRRRLISREAARAWFDSLPKAAA